MNDTLKGKSPDFQLRRAHRDDFDFAERLYIETMKPLLTELDGWDEADILKKFKGYYLEGEVQIIQVDGENAGWLQIGESEHEIDLSQIHIRPQFRSRGIGTRLIQDLFDRARAKNKCLSLLVLRNNRAIALYERLGFKLAGEDGHKLLFRWNGDDVEEGG